MQQQIVYYGYASNIKIYTYTHTKGNSYNMFNEIRVYDIEQHSTHGCLQVPTSVSETYLYISTTSNINIGKARHGNIIYSAQNLYQLIKINILCSQRHV